MSKKLDKLTSKIEKLKFKRDLIDEQLEPLEKEREQLEGEEILAVCKKNKITIKDLMDMNEQEVKETD